MQKGNTEVSEVVTSEGNYHLLGLSKQREEIDWVYRNLGAWRSNLGAWRGDTDLSKKGDTDTEISWN